MAPSRPRKQFPLRVSPELYDALEAWAGDEFRSVNAQIEAILADAVRRAGRARPAKRPREGDDHDIDIDSDSDGAEPDGDREGG